MNALPPSPEPSPAVPPSDATDLMSYSFTVRLAGGVTREVTAFRRKPGGPWTMKPRHMGRQCWTSLHVVGSSKSDLELLKKRATLKLQALADSRFAGPVAKVEKAAPVALVGVALARYLDRATAVSFRGRIEKKVAQQNVAELRRVIRIGLGRPEMTKDEVDGLPLSVLTRALVDQFLKHYLAEVETVTHEDRNELAVDKRSNGASSALRQARSIFARNKLEVFVGLTLPDLTGFREAAVLGMRPREHKAIAPEVVAAMHAAAEGLKADRPRLWLIHTVLKHLGLRPSEAHEAELGWLMRTAWGQWFLAVVVTEKRRPKASLGYTPIAREVALEIMRVRQVLAEVTGEELVDGSPLIPGATRNERWDAIYREHSEWMRAFVPAATHEKSNYELRRWATQTVRRKYGKDASSDFARHSARDVTQQHYLERLNVWRDRATDGNAGITWEDARGSAGEHPATAAAPSDWRGLIGGVDSVPL